MKRIKQDLPPESVTATPHTQEITIARGLRTDLPIEIDSRYHAFFSAYVARYRAEKGLIISAMNATTIIGIGFIEANRQIGTFFGDCIEKMIAFSRVKYVHAERMNLGDMGPLIRYDIYHIPQLPDQPIEYDHEHIKPLAPKYLHAVMKMIANHDYGRSNARLNKWVLTASKQDLCFVAVVPITEEWIRDIADSNAVQAFNRPLVVDQEYIAGVGFATPGEKMGWLYSLYTHPGFRNRGIGRELACARLSALASMGIEDALTEIAEFNRPAKGIYAKLHGVEFIGKITLFGKQISKITILRH